MEEEYYADYDLNVILKETIVLTLWECHEA